MMSLLIFRMVINHFFSLAKTFSRPLNIEPFGRGGAGLDGMGWDGLGRNGVLREGAEDVGGR